MMPSFAQMIKLKQLMFLCSFILTTTNSLISKNFDQTPIPIKIRISSLPWPYTSTSAHKVPKVLPIPRNATLAVPKGFKIDIFIDTKLCCPRWLTETPTGDVLVTETPCNRIKLLSRRINGKIQASIFASQKNGLNLPFGMAFVKQSNSQFVNQNQYWFFLGNANEVRRFSYQIGQSSLGIDKGWRILPLPAGGYNQHWTRNVIPHPDGKHIYVSVGSGTNDEIEVLPRASVMKVSLDGTSNETVASGLRNPVGLDVHPITKDLYTTVNERDGLGDDLVPDYLTRIKKGEFYGWPYAFLSPELLDPRHVTIQGQSVYPQLASRTQKPDVLFQAHSVALGLQFYDKTQFPQRYRNGAFVAFRGSWNRHSGTGFKIVFVPFNSQNRPLDQYEDFVTGFLINPSGPTTWGRPVGLLVSKNGELLFTEEINNVIYRVSYGQS